MSMDYWKECVSIAMDETGLKATPEQIEYVAGAVESGHENYGMAFYQPPPSENPVYDELKKAKDDLRKELEKRRCDECEGYGRITTYGGTHQSTMPCFMCNGRGRR